MIAPMFNDSSTVAVRFHPCDFPRDMAQAAKLFAEFGEIAKIDTVLGLVKGLVIVTFFDIRSLEKVVAEFGDRATLMASEGHDFRAVKIPLSAFAGAELTALDLARHGEVWQLSQYGADMLIKYYDMRAAQKVILSVPGSLPWHPQAQKELPKQHLPPGLEPGHQWVTNTTISGSVHAQTKAEDVIGVPTSKLPKSFSQAFSNANGASGKVELAPVGNVAHTACKKNAPTRNGIKNQDHHQFDIFPEQIMLGVDMRTTVMIRNIPESCSANSFLEEHLPQEARDKLTFFYMPFDKKNSRHSGSAFVNLESPLDVLAVYMHINKLATKGRSKRLIAVSYARLQGHAALAGHFSQAAVMHEKDARQRPIFSVDRHQQQQSYEQNHSTNLNGSAYHRLADEVLSMLQHPSSATSPSMDLPEMQPCYISMPEDKNPWSRDVSGSTVDSESSYALRI